ncbi:MAG: glycosyltransferase family 2 protein [Chloroflexi bacterium]|nr:glycosyltransferase family 2 protein [Chloroflexota bacterium]
MTVELSTSGSVYLSVVLPAYNEARSIRSSISKMREFLDAQGYTYEIIVASDGDDDTPVIVREIASAWPGLKLTAEPGRHGKGYGLRRGMRLATGQIVGFIDADYKTPIDEIAGFLPWFDAGYDLVVGSRALEDSRIEVYQPLYRQIGSKLFAIGMHTLVGLHHIRDTQCGFKFFTRAAAADIFSRARIDGYMCDVEILYIAERLGYSVKECGIQWRDDRDSRLNLVRGNIQNIVELLRIRFGSQTASVADRGFQNRLAS